MCFLNNIILKSFKSCCNLLKWTTKYNTAYNGEYTITYDRDKFVEKDRDKDEHFDEKTPFPVMFCISNYNHQHVISYHYVDTKNIPNKYR